MAHLILRGSLPPPPFLLSSPLSPFCFLFVLCCVCLFKITTKWGQRGDNTVLYALSRLFEEIRRHSCVLGDAPGALPSTVCCFCNCFRNWEEYSLHASHHVCNIAGMMLRRDNAASSNLADLHCLPSPYLPPLSSPSLSPLDACHGVLASPSPLRACASHVRRRRRCAVELSDRAAHVGE